MLHQENATLIFRQRIGSFRVHGDDGRSIVKQTEAA